VVIVCVSQTYVALLKGFLPECKDVIRSAVDILVPCLPVRMPQDEFVRTIKWTKKLLMEETHNVQNLLHILQVIVRHPDVFYSHRHQVIPQMITCMSRIGLPHNAALDNRIVALNVADVLVNWEWCRLKRLESIKAEAVRNEPANRTDGESEVGGKRSLGPTESIPVPAPKMMRSETAPQSSSSSSQISSSGKQILLPPPSLARSVSAPSQSQSASLHALDERDNDRTLTHIQIHLVANFIIRLGSLASESKDPTFFEDVASLFCFVQENGDSLPIPGDQTELL
jgi:hypothetical protein